MHQSPFPPLAGASGDGPWRVGTRGRPRKRVASSIGRVPRCQPTGIHGLGKHRGDGDGGRACHAERPGAAAAGHHRCLRCLTAGDGRLGHDWACGPLAGGTRRGHMGARFLKVSSRVWPINARALPRQGLETRWKRHPTSKRTDTGVVVVGHLTGPPVTPVVAWQPARVADGGVHPVRILWMEGMLTRLHCGPQVLADI